MDLLSAPPNIQTAVLGVVIQGVVWKNELEPLVSAMKNK